MDITVIIPAYNRIWALPRAIESCKSSSGLSIQIIVVDDGSTDGTWEMLLKTEGIEIYRQQHWGKPWAVNMAFLHAKGKYIKFLDSDDWLVAGAIEKQYELAENENADIVVAGYNIFDGEKYIRTQEWVVCDDFIAQNLGECDSSHYSAFLFRKDFVKDIPHRTSFASANFASRDDRCFMLETALKEPKIAVLKEPALCHSHHEKGRLQFQRSIAATCTNYQHLLIYKNILKQLQETGRLTKRRIKAAINILWPLCHWIAKDNINEGAGLYQWILELDPEFIIPKSSRINLMYRKLGFTLTERILAFRRFLKYG
jgi:glycosyltransferase involved in cell wall biosynthesis